MPRLSKPLTAIQVRNAKPKATPYKLADSRGLHLLVLPSGSKHWRFRYRLAGKENMFAIGAYPDISLALAREACDDARKLVSEGIHPSHARQTERKATETAAANTFKAIAEKWIHKNKNTEKRRGWSDYYCYQVERTLANDVYPDIGNLPIRQVIPAHVLDIIERVSTRKTRGGKVGAPSVAILIRQWCSAIFQFAISTNKASWDPAAALKGAIARPKVQHKNALDGKGITEFLRKLESAPGVPQTHIALKLLLLTFVRPGELRCAGWEEFDLEDRIWTIPGKRMKMGETHLVPLSNQTIELLKRLRAIDGSRPLLFPNVRAPNRPMSPTTLNRCLERMGYAGYFSAHGFRATASTYFNELDWRSDVIEIQLAHQERNKSRKAYNHAKYLPQRRVMMQNWADHIDALGASGNVVPFVQASQLAARQNSQVA